MSLISDVKFIQSNSNRFVCFLLFLLQISCAKSSKGEEALNKFTSRFIKEIKNEYGFEVYGVGSSFPVKINEVELCFRTNFPANIATARGIAVPITLKMIERMNQDKLLMQFLVKEPATIENASIRIRFAQGSKNDSPDVVMVIGSKKTIYYDAYNDQRTTLLDLHEETFDEALEIIQQESE